MRELSRNIIGLALLPPVLWLFLNASLNWHYHKLPNGQVICHAHPYNASHSDTPLGEIPFEKHRHSDNEFLFYAHIDKPEMVLAIVLAIVGLVLPVICIFALRQNFDLIPVPLWLHLPTRGPPDQY